MRWASALLTALIEKQAGVQVHLHLRCVGVELNTPKAFFQRLHPKTRHQSCGVQTDSNPLHCQEGLEVQSTGPPQAVDRRMASPPSSGINISNVYSGGSFSRRSKQRPKAAFPARDYHTCQVKGRGGRIPENCFSQPGRSKRANHSRRRNISPASANKGRGRARHRQFARMNPTA